MAGVTLTFNSIAGTNYGFLNRKPGTASLLDVLGPWPWYLLTAGTLVAAVWAAMTWPWVRGALRREDDGRVVGVFGGELIDGLSVDEPVQRAGHRGAFRAG